MYLFSILTVTDYFCSAAGMAALFFPRGGLEEGETLKHKQASGCPGLCRRNVGNIVV
ncbi:hypothetical protein HMPREF1548_01911 [Clostridium sp. KLE 1755]|nr:hypothetical protein HMPREF1548_01911 [Clostridium sp. KLE 1755]